MLTKAQCCRVDDQRGLLTKEQLEVPLFLQLPSEKAENGTEEASTTRAAAAADSKAGSEDKTSVTSAEAVKETSDCAKSKPKDMRETVV